MNPAFSDHQDTTDKLYQWTLTSDVTNNIAKTVAMHINQLWGTQQLTFHITLNPNTPPVVKTNKLLGITIDDELTWKAHTTTVMRASTYCLYPLRCLISLCVSPC